MNKRTAISITAAAVLAVMVAILFIQKPTEKYALSLDPFLDQQTLVTNTHVTVQNTGSQPLTNVRVDYGGGNKPDIIPILNPGEKVILSPPTDNDLKGVTVTTDQGVSVTKPYRTAPKMPGMMGS